MSGIFDDPYGEDEEASITSSVALMERLDDSYSIDSDMSFVARQQRKSRCPTFLMNDSPSVSSQVKRDLNQLMSSRNKLKQAEELLLKEKKRGRCLLFTCIFLCFLCTIFFIDQIPDDWREGLIKYLQAGQNKVKTDTKKNEGIAVEEEILQTVSSSKPSANNSTEVNTKNQEQEKLAEPTQNTIHDSSLHNNDAKPTSGKEENIENRIDKLSPLMKWNYPYKAKSDIPVFWHVPLSGDGAVDRILSRCYNLVQAMDDAGRISGHEHDSSLAMITVDGGRYINVNLGSKEGIKRANKLKLVLSSVPHVIHTPYIYEATEMFQYTGKYGKCFTMLRHPVERAIDLFYQLQSSKNEVFAKMTIDEYIFSPFCEHNWMVRFLSNEMEVALNEKHLRLAQHVLGRKCLVAFTDDFEEGIHRLASYYKWDEGISKDKAKECIHNELSYGQNTTSASEDSLLAWQSPVTKHPQYTEGTLVWNTLKKHNSLDLQLYQYAKGLYQKQELYGQRLLESIHFSP